MHASLYQICKDYRRKIFGKSQLLSNTFQFPQYHFTNNIITITFICQFERCWAWYSIFICLVMDKYLISIRYTSYFIVIWLIWCARNLIKLIARKKNSNSVQLTWIIKAMIEMFNRRLKIFSFISFRYFNSVFTLVVVFPG